MFVKPIAVLCAAVLSYSCSPAVSAQAEMIPLPASLSIYNTSSSLSVSSRTANCISAAQGSVTQTKRITVQQNLQRLNLSGNWSTAASWTQTYNTYYCTMTNTCSGLSGGTYRLKSDFTVKTASGTETVTVYSSLRTI